MDKRTKTGIFIFEESFFLAEQASVAEGTARRTCQLGGQVEVRFGMAPERDGADVTARTPCKADRRREVQRRPVRFYSLLAHEPVRGSL